MLGSNIKFNYFHFFTVNCSCWNDHSYVAALSMFIITLLNGSVIWTTLHTCMPTPNYDCYSHSLVYYHEKTTKYNNFHTIRSVRDYLCIHFTRWMMFTLPGTSHPNHMLTHWAPTSNERPIFSYMLTDEATQLQWYIRIWAALQKCYS
jgi:hypothetical protein